MYQVKEPSFNPFCALGIDPVEEEWERRGLGELEDEEKDKDILDIVEEAYFMSLPHRDRELMEIFGTLQNGPRASKWNGRASFSARQLETFTA